MPVRDRTYIAPSRATRRLVRKRAPVCPAAVADQKMLDLLGRSDVPLSAYDLMERLRAEGWKLTPAAIYRSLERLRARRCVERVETLSAFRAATATTPVLMICVECGRTQPISLPAVHEAILEHTLLVGFKPITMAVEASGVCAKCRSAPDRDGCFE